MNTYSYCMIVLLVCMINELYSFTMPLMMVIDKKKGDNMMILRNAHSYYQRNKVISNDTHAISKVYTTYDHKYSLIFYNNGEVQKSFNSTLKLKCNQDIVQLNIVSLGYFRRLYSDLCEWCDENDIKNTSML